MDAAQRLEVDRLLSHGFTGSAVAAVLGCTRSAVRYAVKKLRTRTAISDVDLDSLVSGFVRQNRHSGERMLQARLRCRSIWVSRQRLRDSMRRVDVVGGQWRRSRRLRRRVYFVPHTNFLWHSDGWHKLIRWKIVVHGALDGYSRTCLYLTASTDNCATTAFAAFLEGVAQFGAPRFLRVDAGGENTLMVRYMRFLRGFNGGIIGRSVHNQRIERFWRDLFYQVGWVFYQVFSDLEALSLLDVHNEEQMRLFHAFFLPHVNAALSDFQATWNVHTIRTEQYRTPAQLVLLSRREFASAPGIGDATAQQLAARWLLEDPALSSRRQRRLTVGHLCTSAELVRKYAALMNKPIP